MLSTISSSGMESEPSVFSSFLAGLSGGASFGPINIYVMNLYITGAVRRGVQFSCGALLGDLTLILGSATILEFLAMTGQLGTVIAISSILLIAIGAKSLLPSSKAATVTPQAWVTSGVMWVIFGSFLTIFSPFGIVVWGALVGATSISNSGLGLALVMFCGSIFWFIVFNLTLWKSSTFLSSRIRHLINRCSAILIIFLGLYGLLRLV